MSSFPDHGGLRSLLQSLPDLRGLGRGNGHGVGGPGHGHDLGEMDLDQLLRGPLQRPDARNGVDPPPTPLRGEAAQPLSPGDAARLADTLSQAMRQDPSQPLYRELTRLPAETLRQLIGFVNRYAPAGREVPQHIGDAMMQAASRVAAEARPAPPSGSQGEGSRLPAEGPRLATPPGPATDARMSGAAREAQFTALEGRANEARTLLSSATAQARAAGATSVDATQTVAQARAGGATSADTAQAMAQSRAGGATSADPAQAMAQARAGGATSADTAQAMAQARVGGATSADTAQPMAHARADTQAAAAIAGRAADAPVPVLGPGPTMTQPGTMPPGQALSGPDQAPVLQALAEAAVPGRPDAPAAAGGQAAAAAEAAAAPPGLPGLAGAAGAAGATLAMVGNPAGTTYAHAPYPTARTRRTGKDQAGAPDPSAAGESRDEDARGEGGGGGANTRQEPAAGASHAARGGAAAATPAAAPSATAGGAAAAARAAHAAGQDPSQSSPPASHFTDGAAPSRAGTDGPAGAGAAAAAGEGAKPAGHTVAGHPTPRAPLHEVLAAALAAQAARSPDAQGRPAAPESHRRQWLYWSLIAVTYACLAGALALLAPERFGLGLEVEAAVRWRNGLTGTGLLTGLLAWLIARRMP